MAEISQDEYERWLAGADKRDALARQRRARAAEREASPTWKFLRKVGRAVNKAADTELRGVPVEIDLDHNQLVYRGQRESLRGVSAAVSTAGSVRSRPTITRFVAFGLVPGVPGLAALVAQKKVDERELFLIIDGPDWQWAVKADPKHTANVRAFAAEVNTAVRRLNSNG
jgi:hypothetical protein